MSDRFRKLSHTIYECKYHIVMCPKYRYRIFKGEIAEYAKQQMYGLCRQKDMVEVLELGKMFWGILFFDIPCVLLHKYL